MMFRFTVLVLLGFAGGFAGVLYAARHFTTALAPPGEITSAEKELIERLVSKTLLDPQSARFDWLKSNGGASYCGEVHARNALGQYVGFSIDVKLDPAQTIVEVEEMANIPNDSPSFTSASRSCILSAIEPRSDLK
jgi:hypothetical protein